MQVEDETSPSRRGRKAHIQVVSRGEQQRTPVEKSDSTRHIPKSRKHSQLSGEQVSGSSFREMSSESQQSEDVSLQRLFSCLSQTILDIFLFFSIILEVSSIVPEKQKTTLGSFYCSH